MKTCPQCQKFYDDDGLQFCLEDGSLLTQSSSYQPPNLWDEPKTVVQEKATNPNYQAAWTPQQPGQLSNWQPQGMNQFPQLIGQNQTMGIVSLVLACLGVCPYIGWFLGPTAFILGYTHRKNIKANPTIYGGDGLALAGMIIGGVLGGLWIALFLFYIIIIVLAIMFGGK